VKSSNLQAARCAPPFSPFWNTRGAKERGREIERGGLGWGRGREDRCSRARLGARRICSSGRSFAGRVRAR
jgi:hypothetical protein